MIREGFGGPGGVAVALRRLGLRSVGLEWDGPACATRAAAGHPTIRCDIAAMPTEPFAGKVVGSSDSPPCQSWTQGGHLLGLEDQPLVHQSVEDLAHGRDTRSKLLAACKDPRSLLAAEPMRWHHAHRPEWITMEEVPAVLPLWQQYAEVLRGWGYSVWCGVINCADYGLGQSRRRAILMASRVRQVAQPEPTHYDPRAGAQLWGQPWVTMADALGWGYTFRPAPTVTGGGTETGGAEPWSSTSRAAMRAAMENPGRWVCRKPAPADGGKQVSDLNLSISDAARLQGFPDGYPFAGRKGQQSLQVGNAWPPPVAEVFIAAAAGIRAPALLAGEAA